MATEETEQEQRRRYVVGALKIPAADRDVAHSVVGTSDDAWAGRGFLDCLGADTVDDDDTWPVGAPVAYALDLTDDEADRFRAASNCRYVELDEPHVPTTAPGAGTIPTPRTQAYMRAGSAEVAGWHGRDITIGIVDQGTTAAVRTYMGWTLVARQNFGDAVAAGNEIHPTNTTTSGFYDHGCLVAPNLVPAGGRIVDALAVSATDGKSSTARFAAAVRWCADQGAKVVNYSFSGASPSSVQTDALDYLRTLGVLLFCAAGNDNLPSVAYPAGYNRTYANVHALIAFDELSNSRGSFSNHAADATGCAPGVDVTTLTPTATVRTWSGTSAASPHAAQLAARLLTGNAYTTAQVGNALKVSLRDTGQVASEQAGGAYDLRRALRSLGSLPAPPTRTNLCTNPSGELGVVGWTTESTPPSTAPERVAAGYTPAGVYHAVTRPTAASGTTSLRFFGPPFAVTAGQSYVVSVFARRNRPQVGGSRLYLRWYDAGGQVVAGVVPPPVLFPGRDVWHRLSSTATAPAGAATARPYLFTTVGDFPDDTSSPDETRVDGWCYEPGTDVEPYFDGSTSGARWTGTPHASISSDDAATAPPTPEPVVTPPLVAIPVAPGVRVPAWSIGSGAYPGTYAYPGIRPELVEFDDRFWLGPLGRMRALPDTQSQLDTTSIVVGGTQLALRGGYTRDRYAVKSRWVWTYPLLTPNQQRYVNALHEGVVPGPLYLIDPRRPNRLPKQTASGGSIQRSPAGFIGSNTSILTWRALEAAPADPDTLPASPILRGCLEWQLIAAGAAGLELAGRAADGKLDVPVLPGEPISVSAWACARQGVYLTGTVTIFDRARRPLLTVQAPSTPLELSAWRKAAVAIVMPDRAAYLRWQPSVSSTTPIGSIWITALQVALWTRPVVPGLQQFCPDPDPGGGWDPGGGGATVIADPGTTGRTVARLHSSDLTLIER